MGLLLTWHLPQARGECVARIEHVAVLQFIRWRRSIRCLNLLCLTFCFVRTHSWTAAIATYTICAFYSLFMLILINLSSLHLSISRFKNKNDDFLTTNTHMYTLNTSILYCYCNSLNSLPSPSPHPHSLLHLHLSPSPLLPFCLSLILTSPSRCLPPPPLLSLRAPEEAGEILAMNLVRRVYQADLEVCTHIDDLVVLCSKPAVHVLRGHYVRECIVHVLWKLPGICTGTNDDWLVTFNFASI